MSVSRGFLTILLGLFPLSLNAQVAHLEGAQGSVEVKAAKAATFEQAKIGQSLFDGDIVHTTKDSRATLAFIDGSILRLSENSSLALKPVGGDTHLGIETGKAYLFSREQHQFPIVDTPSATTAIRGTEISIDVTKDQTKVALLDGQAEVNNSKGKVLLSSGEQSTVKYGVAPRKEIILKPVDAVEWTLPYPLIVTTSDFDHGQVSGIIDAWNDGNTTKAFDLASKLPANEQSTAIVTAALNIGVGKVPAAEAILQKSLSKTSNKLEASRLALSGIIALTKNDLVTARQLAAQSEAASNQSHAAAMLNSAVAQADFDLDRSLEWLKLASERDPSSAIALAHAAELELGRGDLSNANQLVSRAIELSPNNAYVLSVHGFTALLSEKIEQAQSDFTKSLQSDSNLAESRLGLGLVAFRQGRNDDAKQEMQQAVALSPVKSLFRSYLGKAFFESDNDLQALNEYDHALELDPNDPTPYLYRSYYKESHNDPIGALADIEASIMRNDNRAVYRSRLLLDQDAGVRAASLARTFVTLGFDKIARIEAIRSLQSDYRNYSAHLLLAQSSTGILLNDALVSETEIADLLSPPNFNLLFDQGGSATLNEYSALFDKREERGQVRFDGSSYDDLIAPGITYGKRGESFGWALGQDTVLTDGSAKRSAGRLYKERATIEYQPSYYQRFGLQSSARYDRIDEVTNGSSETQIEDYDLGVNSATRLGPNADLIAQLKLSSQVDHFLYRDTQRDGLASITGSDFDGVNPDTFIIDQLYRDRVRQLRGEIQHIWNANIFSFINGAQVAHAAPLRREKSLIHADALEIFEDGGGELSSRSHSDLDSGDIYNYTDIHLTPWLTTSLGASWSDVRYETSEVPPFSDETKRRQRLNPKFGVVLTPLLNTTIRSAYFEELRKSSLEDNAAIEPTLIGGINQRFTDFSGARSRNIGLGIDHKIANSTYFGVEALKRHVVDDIASNTSTAVLDFANLTQSTEVQPGAIVQLHKDENSLHSYIYQVLPKNLVASLEHDWFSFERTNPEVPQDVDLHRVRAAIRYFDPSGFYPFVQSVFRSQDRSGDDFLDDGRENFTTIDAGVGYRLPHRKGNIVLKVENIFDRDFQYDQSFGVEERVHQGVGATIGVQIDF